MYLLMVFLLSAGHSIQTGKLELLPLKIENSEIQNQSEKLKASKKANKAIKKSVEPQKAEITFDDFYKTRFKAYQHFRNQKIPSTKKQLILKCILALIQEL